MICEVADDVLGRNLGRRLGVLVKSRMFNREEEGLVQELSEWIPKIWKRQLDGIIVKYYTGIILN